MSQENVEIVRRAIEAFNRRDLQALADECHDDWEFVSVLTAIDAEDATYRGAEGWPSYFAVRDEMWEEWQAKEPRLFNAGNERVACLYRLAGQGKRSGVPVDRLVGVTYELREGKLWRMRSYAEPAEALEAVGLSE